MNYLSTFWWCVQPAMTFHLGATHVQHLQARPGSLCWRRAEGGEGTPRTCWVVESARGSIYIYIYVLKVAMVTFICIHIYIYILYTYTIYMWPGVLDPLSPCDRDGSPPGTDGGCSPSPPVCCGLWVWMLVPPSWAPWAHDPMGPSSPMAPRAPWPPRPTTLPS